MRFPLFLFIFLLSVSAWSSEETTDAPETLEECHAQLVSGEFAVTDSRKDHRPLPHVTRRLAKSIQEIIERQDGTERFDRRRQEVLKCVIDGRCGISETSEDILDNCFFAVHPDAEVAE